MCAAAWAVGGEQSRVDTDVGGGVTAAVGNDVVDVSGATGSPSTPGSTSIATTATRSFAGSPAARTAAVTRGRFRHGRLIIIVVSMAFARSISTSATRTATMAA